MKPFNPRPIINLLAQNEATFKGLLENTTPEEYTWRPAPNKWNLLEILCHLYDEEREDFRARIDSVITNHAQVFTPIDPQGWVTARKYAEQDFEKILQQFVAERKKSILWLNELVVSDWHSAYQHATFGPMSAAFLLSNWLAHDYLHIRQITRYKYEYLRSISSESLNYAGAW